MMYILYTLLITLILPFVFLRLYIRGRHAPAYRERWSERLGDISFSLEECIWIHTVSLGEAIAATPYIKQMIETYGDGACLITTTTPTGSHYVRKHFGEQAHHCYFPYDHPFILNKFFDRMNPRVLILMETELWPNLLKTCKTRGVPSILINARLSARSKRRYEYFSQIVFKMLNCLTLVAAQTQDDARRLIEIGTAPDKVHITGNIKYDINIPHHVHSSAAELRANWADRPVWIAGSTHEGEEREILNAHHLIRQSIPNALLILVPRHPERFDSVCNLIERSEFSVVRRSEGNACDADTAVFLGDTMGEMLIFYGASDVAFVGGSLIERGGHNLLEPAALAKPCLTGPHTFNFVQVNMYMIQAEAARVVDNAEALAHEVVVFFRDPELREKTGQAALEVVNRNKGALARMMAMTKELIEHFEHTREESTLSEAESASEEET